MVKNKYRDNIKKVADFRQHCPNIVVIIEDHTRYPENDIKLCQSRADSVRQYLIDEFGIDEYRIEAVGYGPNRPIADNDTEEGRKKNRRVEAVIDSKN